MDSWKRRGEIHAPNTELVATMPYTNIKNALYRFPLFQQEFGRVCGEASGHEGSPWRRRCSHRHGHIMLMGGYEREIHH
jgi:hypothetical protein